MVNGKKKKKKRKKKKKKGKGGLSETIAEMSYYEDHPEGFKPLMEVNTDVIREDPNEEEEDPRNYISIKTPPPIVIPEKLNTPKKKKKKVKDSKKKTVNQLADEFELDPSLGIVKEESKEQSTILRSRD
jgi:hypothetical protein